MDNSLAQDYADTFSVISKAETLPWLATYREDAFTQLEENKWPTRRDEDWKYTDLSALARTDFQPVNDQSTSISQEDIKTLNFMSDSHRLLFINGRYSPQHSTIGALPEQVQIGNLHNALSKQPDLLEPIFNQCIGHKKHIFSALNTALFSDGAFIYVPDNMIVDHPIQLYFITNSVQQPLVSMPRNLIILGKHAQATVIESFHDFGDAPSFTNTITEIQASDNTKLEYYKLQLQAGGGFHIGGTHIRQHRDSHIESHSIVLGGAIVRNDIDTALLGENATIRLNGLYKVAGKQHIDNHTLINHMAARTQSEQDYRGILKDSARAVFNGAIIVQQGTHHIKAMQSNANLLLSDNAEVDTKPELQIYADDVLCNHGTTVGQLDEDMLFYLRSRGIEEKEAKNLLLLAFVEDLLMRIKCLPIRQCLHNIGDISNTDVAGVNRASLNA